VFACEDPDEPQGEISQDEALGLPGYYEAYFDSSSHVVKLRAYGHGKLYLSVQYWYRGDGTAERALIVGTDGDTVVKQYDAKGHVVPEKTVRK
jgi:hypothetical protein